MRTSSKAAALRLEPKARCKHETVKGQEGNGKRFIVRDSSGRELGRAVWSSADAWRKALGALTSRVVQ